MGRYLVLILVAASLQASADSFQPSHSCSEPTVPYEFNNEFERQNFINEVEEYKGCLSDFVEEQNDAVQKHKAAAEEAIDEWNSFASSLN
ncbi:hypothetical protein LF841_17855 [Pseudomonas aeruginosa]|uniref:hypothetical protein n=1 Tax=Pseudomonas aeruginosa TaxID=287 RepID=UPI00209E29D9|nr:hypothetical protein [Pseudomonas aeruginosa]EME5359046.1 hypothetical protein [Pseudomonas aeruginosa]MCO5623821.1 hypothetical protein [Pseudomonas aeruginosa]